MTAARYPSRPDSFTLVELLVVLSIIVILSAVTLPAITSVLRSSRLSTAGNTLVDQLNLARQTAMARDCLVEFRFYKLPDSNASFSSTATTYRAFQAYSLDKNGAQTNAITKVIYLPAGIAVTNSPTYSTLLPATASNPPYQVNGTTSGAALGPYPPASYSYMDFHFKPNGTTDLNPNSSSTWFVSLINLHDSSVGPNGLPNNFVTVQVDPLSGRPRSFRPN